MMLIPCPHCGPRNSTEFRYVGEAAARPAPDAADATAWRTYLYFRRNPAGWTRETWFHRMGCRRYFQVERHTVTNQVRTNQERSSEERTNQVRTDQVRGQERQVGGQEST